MSVGNLKDSGNKGNNFPYQLAVLKLLDGILNAVGVLPGVDYELRTTHYKANKAGVGYSNGDFISRVDIINAATGVIISTLWFNETTGLSIAAPPIADLDPYIPPSSVTVANLPATLGQALMANSLAVTIASNQSTLTVNDVLNGILIGSLTEAAPATDTASSGLNGRLQRIAQRITSLIGLVPTSLGQKTMANSFAVTVASDQSSLPVTPAATENFLGAVGGKTSKVQVTPTVSNAVAYTALDNVGGIMTIALALRTNNGTGILQDLTIWDKDNQKAAYTIDIWNASPSGTYTDNAAEVIAGDQAKYLGTILVAAGDYTTTGAVARANIKGIGMALLGASTTSLFATVQTTGTPTFTSTSGLVFSFGILQD